MEKKTRKHFTGHYSHHRPGKTPLDMWFFKLSPVAPIWVLREDGKTSGGKMDLARVKIVVLSEGVGGTGLVPYVGSSPSSAVPKKFRPKFRGP